MATPGSGDEYDNDGQYRGTGIPRYEKIFGKGFISTGGLATTREVVEQMEKHGLTKGSKVFDIGSGIGGSAFYMHDKFGADVTGVDLAPGMVREAQANVGERTGVRFILGDASKIDVTEGSFDFVYSRDTLLHIEDKQSFFGHFHRFLAPGGWVVLTDYAFRDDEDKLGEEFTTYYKNTGYHLCSLKNYAAAAAAAGFEVEPIDFTARLNQSLVDEMKWMEENKADFCDGLPESDWTYLMERWQKKVRMIAAGDMKWILLVARKPL